MSERSASVILFLLGFLLFAEFLSWETASWPGPCLLQETHEAAAHGRQCPVFHEAVGILVKRSDEFMERHDKSIVAAFTIILAISTIGLWFATVRLWDAGERQLKLIQQNAVEQSRDMRASISAARASADAAARSAEVAEKALTLTERAFVFMKYAYASPMLEFSTAMQVDRVVGWNFHIVWENAGSTPTQNMFTYKNLLHMKGVIPNDFNFPDIVVGDGEKYTPKTFIGPKSEKDAGGKYVPISEIVNCAARLHRIYMWGWAEYSDIFRPDRRSRSEFCFEVVITGDPKVIPSAGLRPPFDFVVFNKHNGSEGECYRQPGETIPILRYSPQ